MAYKLLTAFEYLFTGQAYRHRVPTQGDAIASYLYEDLYDLKRSNKFVTRVSNAITAVNAGNVITGRAARRGDGTFGEVVPQSSIVRVPGFNVVRAPVANLQIGCEVKIIATAVGKQTRERVASLKDQSAVFKSHGSKTIRVAIVGINHAAVYEAYEGSRVTRTNGTVYKHPSQEGPASVLFVRNELKMTFDEVIVLPFIASNISPFTFAWVNPTTTQNEYDASILRISQAYQLRF